MQRVRPTLDYRDGREGERDKGFMEDQLKQIYPIRFPLLLNVKLCDF